MARPKSLYKIHPGGKFLHILFRATNRTRKDLAHPGTLPNTKRDWNSMEHSYNFMTSRLGKELMDTLEDELDTLLNIAPDEVQRFLGDGVNAFPKISYDETVVGGGLSQWRRINSYKPYKYVGTMTKSGVRVCFAYEQYVSMLMWPLRHAVSKKVNDKRFVEGLIREYMGG